MSKKVFKPIVKDTHYSELMKKIEINHKGDPEAIHIEADKLLLEILVKELDLTETVKEFNNLEKYYA